ncbi:MFS transporter [Glycomyces sp. NPDC046736]|uniref:MFS transporter n=1 Tax=Glycomyces sp. NPDC046736 TaxID=3155615 RepID=UPI0033F678B3
MTGPSRAAVAVALAATFAQLLDLTMVSVAVPHLRADLDAGAGAGQLVIAGYTLAYACTLATAARLGDRYGYRRLLRVGLALFALAAAWCAIADEPVAFIAGRVLQGVASGLMAPQVLSVIQISVPRERRHRAMAYFAAAMGLASLIGPILGGLLITADPWDLGRRLIFGVDIAVAGAALVAARMLPRTRGANQRIDHFGAVLAMSGLALLLAPLTLGRDSGWPPWTFASIFLGVSVLTVFAATQRRTAAPLLHPDVWRHRSTRAGIGLVLVFNAGVPSFSYLLFVHLQTGAGHSALGAGLAASPFAAAAILGSHLGRRRDLGPAALTSAAAVMGLSMAALALSTWFDLPLWTHLPWFAAAGAGFGVFTASAFTLVLSRIDPAAVGSVSGLLPTAQQLGGTIGVTAAGLVHASVLTDPNRAMSAALVYEAAVFGLAAALAWRLGRTRPTGVPRARRRAEATR